MKEFTINEFMPLINGYKKSRIILSAWELDIFTIVENTDGTKDKIFKMLKTDERATQILLDVLTSLGLLVKKENSYFNTAFSKKYLVKSSKEYLSGLGHSGNLWNLWSGLTRVVKEGKPNTANEINERDEEWLSNFIEAMHYRAQKQAPETIHLLDLSNVNSVLDIGGGSGIFSMAFVDANSKIKSTVFDLPNVIPLTKKYIKQEGYTNSIKTKAGDYTKDDIGTGYDLIFLSAIIHSNSYKTNEQLVKKCYKALNKGGQIVISDFILSSNRLEPYYAAEFAVNMLVATAEGNTYTEEEISNWFEDAGFKNTNKIDLPTKGAMMIAYNS
ncbi:MAG: methyltransferase domain-containing protein [Chlorobi bacterium]|nr:methyltransferase domain-containing protein [Chlorobiota bacterium]